MLYLVYLYYCMWKGKFLLVESVFEDTRTRSGLVERDTDAKQISIGRHGKIDPVHNCKRIAIQFANVISL